MSETVRLHTMLATFLTVATAINGIIAYAYL